MKHRGKTIFTYIMLILMIGSGCNGANTNNEANQVKITNVTNEKKSNQNMTDQVKQLFSNQKEVNNVNAVNSDKELLIAVEVNHMDRFRLKEIEKQLKQMAEKQYPNHKVTLSTDQKIFLELEKLENKMQKNNINKKKLEKELNRIKSLAEEQT